MNSSRTRSLLRYAVFIVVGAYLLSFAYGTFAYQGQFFPFVFILIAFVIWCAFGEAFLGDGENGNAPFFLLIVAALILFVHGHWLGYQREIQIVSEALRLESNQPAEISDRELFHRHLQTVLGPNSPNGFWGYIKYRRSVGFDEPTLRRWGPEISHAEGGWNDLSWLYQFILLFLPAASRARGAPVFEAKVGEDYELLREKNSAISFPIAQPKSRIDIRGRIREASEEKKRTQSVARQEPVPQYDFFSAPKLGSPSSEASQDPELFKQFAQAISARRYDEIESLIESSRSPNLRDQLGTTLLMALVSERIQPELLERYAEFGADPKLTDAQGDTILHHISRAYASSSGYLEWYDRPLKYGAQNLAKLEWLAARIIASGGDVQAQNNQGVTPLMEFSKAASFSFFTFIMERELDLDIEDQKGKTAMMYAAEGGDAQKLHLRLLVERGASITARASDRRTAVEFAARKGAKVVVGFLLDRLAKDITPTLLGKLCLETVHSGNVSLMRTLLERGADPEAESERGKPPLFLAIEQNKNEMVKVLRAAGASITPKTPTQRSSIIAAAASRDPELLREILDAGGDPNTREDGYSAINSAVNLTWKEGLQILEEAGADFLLWPHNHTPLMALAKKADSTLLERFEPVLQFLTERPIPIDQRDDFGFTALHYLCGAHNYSEIEERENHRQAAFAFLSLGADPNHPSKRGTPLELAQHHRLDGILEIFALHGHS